VFLKILFVAIYNNEICENYTLFAGKLTTIIDEGATSGRCSPSAKIIQ